MGINVKRKFFSMITSTQILACFLTVLIKQRLPYQFFHFQGTKSTKSVKNKSFNLLVALKYTSKFYFM